MIFLQILLLAQRVSGTIMPIIGSSRVLYRWLLLVVFGALVFKLLVWCGAEGYVSGLRAAQQAATTCNNTLELLMMGIVVPETCWASNKICGKNHLLHLVGILFPHINDDARWKSHQICYSFVNQLSAWCCKYTCFTIYVSLWVFAFLYKHLFPFMYQYAIFTRYLLVLVVTYTI